MKTSYFNPEVHSFTFRNFNHVVCGVSWGAQCGGMCCTALSKFYNGALINCESGKSGFEDEIWNNQVGIIGSDIYKSCRWGSSIDAVSKISDNIDIGKPTLLYLDQEDWSLVDDHFVVAYALDDIISNIQKVYIYDPNYVYKRHYCYNPSNNYCSDPDSPGAVQKNFDSFLELNYNDQTVILKHIGFADRQILGFKWYGQDETGIPVNHYTDEKDIQHSCNMTLISCQPEIVKTKPLICHTIKISKDGNVPADLKLSLGGQELYESGNNLFPYALRNEFSSPVEHIGLQSGKGHFEKIYKIYQDYVPSNPGKLILQSNFIEKSLWLTFNKPAIKTFWAYLEGTTPPYFAVSVNDQIIRIQGLKEDNVAEVELVPEEYQGSLPVNWVSFTYSGDNLQEAIDSGEYSLLVPIFYLGYFKNKVVIELTHNGLYTDATVKMTIDNSSPIEKPFINNEVKFTLPAGNEDLYDSNASKNLHFEINGGGISAGFSESFSAILQYRCLIVHEPIIHKIHNIEFPIFARYFEKLLINIPHTVRLPDLEERFNIELKKNPGMDKEKFKRVFCEQLIKTFASEAKTSWSRKRLYSNFIDSFSSNEAYRKERIDFIVNKSKSFQELKQNFEILEDQMRPLIGRALVTKKTFNRFMTKLLKSKWK